jgi:hypothetical protein
MGSDLFEVINFIFFIRVAYLAFLVISESVLILEPFITGIAQAATGYIIEPLR